MESDPARRFFDASLSDRERAIFEGGIALGTLYHQFVGTPISSEGAVVRALETAIEKTIGVQPYRERVRVKIDGEGVEGEGVGPYRYHALKGRHLTVQVTIRYGRARATAEMRYIPELQFNLMHISKVEEAVGLDHGV